ncbi:MAG: beta-aspartyl-peptidase [Acidobacteriota bacterium]|nr:beta-aspartyl-peptidase [Acidobacteriota bacterium]
MILLKNGNVFAPNPLGRQDILLAGGIISAVAPKLDTGSLDVEIIDLAGLRVVPGFIDGHTHLCGAGGEGGPATRTPELQLGQLVGSGVTTAVGCLGTDGITRTIAGLLMKAKGLTEEGMTCRIYTGSYQVPPPTLCGDVAHDLCYIQEVIGAGEIAIADKRSSAPTAHELARLAKRIHVAGMLGGKAGILHLHMGDEAAPFSVLHEAVRLSQLPHACFFPTHINRNGIIFEEAAAWGKVGPLDITTGSYPFFKEIEVKPAYALARLLKLGVPAGHITMSSDAGGSLPRFDNDGNLEGLAVGLADTLLTELKDAVNNEAVPFETALATITANPAAILKLKSKGRLAPNMDADLVIMDDNMDIHHVIARGKPMVRNGEPAVKGTFES